MNAQWVSHAGSIGCCPGRGDVTRKIVQAASPPTLAQRTHKDGAPSAEMVRTNVVKAESPVRGRRTAGSSCLASLARRNDRPFEPFSSGILIPRN